MKLINKFELYRCETFREAAEAEVRGYRVYYEDQLTDARNDVLVNDEVRSKIINDEKVTEEEAKASLNIWCTDENSWTVEELGAAADDFLIEMPA